MRHKLLGTILSLLMVFSVLSVGFASWTITAPMVEAEAEGIFQADDIVKVSDYLDMPTPTTLKYNKDGFLGSDKLNSSINSNGYRLHVKACKDKFNIQEIQIQIKLNYIDLKPAEDPRLNIFEKIKVVATHNGNTLNSNINSEVMNKVGITTTITISGNDMNLNDYYFDLSYNFGLTSEYFNNPLSPLWTKSQPVFKISAVLLFKANA